LFAIAKDEEIVPQDYRLKATSYAKENPDQVVAIYMDAAREDTSVRNKLLILQDAVEWAKTAGQKIPEANLRLEMFKLQQTRIRLYCSRLVCRITRVALSKRQIVCSQLTLLHCLIAFTDIIGVHCHVPNWILRWNKA
jgi:hypothetical protein